MFSIFESLFLVALDDEKGGFVESCASGLQSILAGAALASLLLEERIQLVEGRVFSTGEEPHDHPILQKVMFGIVAAGKPRKLKYWLNTLTVHKIEGEIRQVLVENKFLVRKKRKIHLVPLPSENGQGGGTAQYAVKVHLREIILAGKPAGPEDRVLLAFLYYSRLLKLVFTSGELRQAYKRIKQLIIDEEGSTLGETMDEIVALSCELMTRQNSQ